MTFDLTRVRADFPILDEKIFGNRLVYLDSGASAQKPNAVLDKMDEVHRHGYANVHRGLHTLANRATEAYEDGRKAVQRLLNAARPEEIVFTKEGKIAKSACFVPNHAVLQYAGPRDADGLWQEESFRNCVGVKIGMSRIMRTRPIFKDWAAVIEVEFEDSVVNEEQVDRWVNSAGTQVGLCDWRPRCGRFTAEKVAIVKTRKQAPEAVGAV